MPIYLTNPKPRSKSVIKNLINEKITIVDIGAGGGIKTEWHSIADITKFIGFDGSKKHIEDLKNSGFDCDLYNEFIDDKEGESTFYVSTRWCSGLIKANVDFLKRFNSLIVHYPIQEEKVNTITFDKWIEGKYERIDLLKIDVEGSEYNVLHSAKESFFNKKILAILTEIWVDPRQKGQPAFAETDEYIRSHGFHLYDWMPQRSPRKSLPAGILNAAKIDDNNFQLSADSWPFIRWGQILNSDALYFRDPIWDVQNDPDGKWKDFWDKETLLRLILLLDLYQYPDVAIELLSYFRQLIGKVTVENLLPTLVPEIFGKKFSYNEYYQYSLQIHNSKLFPDHDIKENPFDYVEPFDFPNEYQQALHADNSISSYAKNAITKMRPPKDMIIICVDVTNKCDLACSNCTRLLENQDTFWDMTLENFRLAVRSLKNFPGIIAMIGGNPCMHPQFASLCEIFVEEIPNKTKRGLWTNNFFKHKELAEQTFGFFNLNTHGNTRAVKSLAHMKDRDRVVYYEGHSEHSPLLTAIKDLYSEKEMWERIPECDINKNWSASIIQNQGKLRYYFCEVAASFDLARNEDHGFELTDDWWNRDIYHFVKQICHFCPGCGIAVKFAGTMDFDETDLYTYSNADIALKGRKKKGKIIEIKAITDQPFITHKVTDYGQNIKKTE